MNGAQPREKQLHDEGRAERVCEARVFGPGKSERRDAELAHPPEPLHLGGVEQPLDDTLFVPLERDQTVEVS